MLVLITYDVNTEDAAGRKRLRNIAKCCENYGQRVQLSVFECLVDPQQLVFLKGQLLSLMNPKSDSIRIYYLGKNWSRRVEHFGAKTGYDPEGPLLV
jgi:CRISPR-associated protein Cas2